MAKLAIALIGGMLLGIIAMFAIDRSPTKVDEVERDYAFDLRTSMPADSETSSRSIEVTPASVEEVLLLQSEFRRAEALHALAGAANSSSVQNMIFEMNELVDANERSGMLGILFSRLTELEPRTALELARSESFTGTQSLQQTVWRAWARKDFDAALFEAKTQTTLVYQKAAAQHLYAAFGYLENSTVEQIEAELGIAPDRSTRGRYLYMLSDRSPAEAIEYINGISDNRERNEYVSWLAYHLSLRDAGEALRYSALLTRESDATYYDRILNQIIVKEDPIAAIERLMAGDRSRRTSSELRSAIGALAKIDTDAAKQYFDQARSTDERRNLGSAIASAMAEEDPIAALEWARANDSGEFPQMVMSVLQQIAQSDPQLALDEALKTRNIQMRSHMISNVVRRIAYSNPTDAAALLDQITDPRQKIEASQQLVSAWIGNDPDSAVDWILAQDKDTASQIIQRSASRLVQSDIDAAIRLLPKMDKIDQTGIRQQIAQRLAANVSPDEAQSFIQQFEGQPGFEQLQASLITGVAHNDVLMAKQLADQLSVGVARDRAYLQVISKRAETNPEEAVRWLGNVRDEAMRGQASGQIAANWAASDPLAAERWVSELPSGTSRDDAIVHLSSQWREPTPEQRVLIASIESSEKRGQAKIGQIYRLMRTDLAKARELLQDDDISSVQRQQIELMINKHGLRF